MNHFKSRLLEFAKIIGQHSGKTPVFILDFLDDNVRVFGFAEHTRQYKICCFCARVAPVVICKLMYGICVLIRL
jgi:hypothetical protein